MYRKVIKTGSIIEIYEYEKLNVNGGGKREKEGKYKEENYKQSQRSRRNNIRRLICENFDNKSKFLTLTFKNSESLGYDIKDVKRCNTAFKLFMKRLKYKYPGTKYLAVIEFQDKNGRGAVHYHMIIDLPYVSNAELSEIWGQGFVKINAIDKVDNIGAYVIKYMTADIDDKRLMGLKAYNCSKGLKKPRELKSWRYEDDQERKTIEKSIEEKSPSYASTYESEKAGKVTYKQYNLKRL